MKVLVLILSFILSFIDGGRITDVRTSVRHSSCVVEVAGQDNSEKAPNYSTPAILPIQSAGFSGEDTSVAPSVRSTNSGRRIQLSQKFPFRVIKDGKVIDRHCFYTFQTNLIRFSSGIHSTDRYIHSLCQLLI